MTIYFPRLCLILILGVTLCSVGTANAALTVELEFLVSPGQPVGTTIPFVATVEGAGAGIVDYRFEVAALGGPFVVIRDFMTTPMGEWTPMEEGIYLVRATARLQFGIESAMATEPYSVQSRVVGSDPVVSPTLHPLVALFSVPPCEDGEVRVAFRVEGSPPTFSQFTPFKPCKAGTSVNFLVAGMRVATNYLMQHEVVTGETRLLGTPLSFLTSTPSVELPVSWMLNPPDEETSLTNSVLLHAIVWRPNNAAPFPVATDLLGRVLWYYDAGVGATADIKRPVAGGTFLLSSNVGLGQWQMLREIDVAGNTLRETDTRRISEQLLRRGETWIGAFHHEILRLENGHTLVLGSVEKILVDVQGPGAVNVLGDMIIDLDENWQVAWTWNAFDHLDTGRKAILDEKCSGPQSGCPPVFLGTPANDWLHSNTINYLPAEGDLLLSVRNQDWVVKVDYKDGNGSGSVLWSFGKDGDFTLDSGDPLDWFSHQHDTRLEGPNCYSTTTVIRGVQTTPRPSAAGSSMT